MRLVLGLQVGRRDVLLTRFCSVQPWASEGDPEVVEGADQLGVEVARVA